ncbi:hypothetical protein K432DRAFT_307658, partial [Lepidopterella palustris CBS 459.81]
YCEKILPYILAFRKVYKGDVIRPRNIIHIEDGLPVHNARLNEEEYRWHNIIKMWFPANSPDLNPINHI